MKNGIAKAMGYATVLGLSLLGSGTANAITLNEYLFDKGINGTSVYNEIPSGPHHASPIMITIGNPGNLGNLHVAGGPFSNSVPYSSIAMMETPYPALTRWAQDTTGVGLGGLTNLTIEMWVNPYGQANAMTPINFNGCSMTLLPVATGYLLVSQVYDSGLNLRQSSYLGSTVVATGTWSHIAMTYDGNTIKQYLNGAPNGSNTFGTTSAVANTGGFVYIGANAFSQNNFFGDIDEIRVSNVALPSGAGTGLNELAWNATLVPEPSSVALIGLGAGWALSLRRTRR